MDIAYAYTQAYDHRVTPEGAPNRYLDAYEGTLETVIDNYLFRLEQSQTVATEPEVTISPTVQEPEVKGPGYTSEQIILLISLGITFLLAVTVTILLIVHKKRRAQVYQEQ